MNAPNTETRLQLLENAMNTLIHRGDRTDARLTAIEQRMDTFEQTQRLMMDYMRENFEQIHQSLARLEAR